VEEPGGLLGVGRERGGNRCVQQGLLRRIVGDPGGRGRGLVGGEPLEDDVGRGRVGEELAVEHCLREEWVGVGPHRALASTLRSARAPAWADAVTSEKGGAESQHGGRGHGIRLCAGRGRASSGAVRRGWVCAHASVERGQPLPLLLKEPSNVY
jgi:hypothetical protein